MVAKDRMTTLLATFVAISILSRHVFAAPMQSVQPKPNGPCKFLDWGHSKPVPGTQCKQYYICTPTGMSRNNRVRFKWVPMECPSGTLWDSVHGLCNHAEIVICIEIPLNGENLLADFLGESFQEIMGLERQMNLEKEAAEQASHTSTSSTHSGSFRKSSPVSASSSHNLLSGASSALHPDFGSGTSQGGHGMFSSSQTGSGALTTELTFEISHGNSLDGFGMGKADGNFGPPYTDYFGSVQATGAGFQGFDTGTGAGSKLGGMSKFSTSMDTTGKHSMDAGRTHSIQGKTNQHMGSIPDIEQMFMDSLSKHEAQAMGVESKTSGSGTHTTFTDTSTGTLSHGNSNNFHNQNNNMLIGSTQAKGSSSRIMDNTNVANTNNVINIGNANNIRTTGKDPNYLQYEINTAQAPGSARTVASDMLSLSKDAQAGVKSNIGVKSNVHQVDTQPIGGNQHFWQPETSAQKGATHTDRTNIHTASAIFSDKLSPKSNPKVSVNPNKFGMDNTFGQRASGKSDIGMKSVASGGIHLNDFNNAGKVQRVGQSKGVDATNHWFSDMAVSQGPGNIHLGAKQGPGKTHVNAKQEAIYNEGSSGVMDKSMTGVSSIHTNFNNANNAGNIHQIDNAIGPDQLYPMIDTTVSHGSGDVNVGSTGAKAPSSGKSTVFTMHPNMDVSNNQKLVGQDTVFNQGTLGAVHTSMSNAKLSGTNVNDLNNARGAQTIGQSKLGEQVYTIKDAIVFQGMGDVGLDTSGSQLVSSGKSRAFINERKLARNAPAPEQYDISTQHLSSADMTGGKYFEPNTNNFNDAGPNTNNFNDAGPNTNNFNDAGPNVNIFNSPGPNTNNFNNAGPNTNNFNNAGPNTNNFNNAGQDTNNFNDAGPNTNNFNNAGQDTNNVNDVGPNNNNFNDVGPNTHNFNNAGPNTNKFNKAGPNTNKFNDVGPNTNNFNDVGPNTNNFNDVGPNTNNVNDVGPNTNNFNDVGPNTNNFNDVGPNTNNFNDVGPNTNNVNDVGPNTNNFNNVGPNTNNFNTAGPNTNNFNEAGPNTNNFNDAGPNTNNFNDAKPNTNNFNNAGPNTNNFNDAGPNTNNFNNAGPNTNKFNDPGPNTNNFNDAGPNTINFNNAGHTLNADAANFKARNEESMVTFSNTLNNAGNAQNANSNINNFNDAGNVHMFDTTFDKLYKLGGITENFNTNFNNLNNAGSALNVDTNLNNNNNGQNAQTPYEHTYVSNNEFWAIDATPSQVKKNHNVDVASSKTTPLETANKFITDTNIDLSNNHNFVGPDVIYSQGASDVAGTNTASAKASDTKYSIAGNVQNNNQNQVGDQIYWMNDATGPYDSGNTNVDATSTFGTSNEFITKPITDTFNHDINKLSAIADTLSHYVQGSPTAVDTGLSIVKSAEKNIKPLNNAGNVQNLDQTTGGDQYWTNDKVASPGPGKVSMDTANLHTATTGKSNVLTGTNIDVFNGKNAAGQDTVYSKDKSWTIDKSIMDAQLVDTNSNNANNAGTVQNNNQSPGGDQVYWMSGAVETPGSQNANVDVAITKPSSIGTSKTDFMTNLPYEISNNQNVGGLEAKYNQGSTGVGSAAMTDSKLIATKPSDLNNAGKAQHVDLTIGPETLYAINDGAVIQGPDNKYVDTVSKTASAGPSNEFITGTNVDVPNNKDIAGHDTVYSTGASVIVDKGLTDVQSIDTNVNNVNDAGALQSNVNANGGDQIYWMNDVPGSSANTNVDTSSSKATSVGKSTGFIANSNNDALYNQNTGGQEPIYSKSSSGLDGAHMSGSKSIDINSTTMNSPGNTQNGGQTNGHDALYANGTVSQAPKHAETASTASTTNTFITDTNVDLSNNKNLVGQGTIYKQDSTLSANKDKTHDNINQRFMSDLNFGVGGITDTQGNTNSDVISSKTSPSGSSNQYIAEANIDVSNNQNVGAPETVYNTGSTASVGKTSTADVKSIYANVNNVVNDVGNLQNADQTIGLDQFYSANDAPASQGSDKVYADASTSNLIYSGTSTDIVTNSNIGVSNNQNAGQESMYSEGSIGIKDKSMTGVKSVDVNLNNAGNPKYVEKATGKNQLNTVNEATVSQGLTTAKLDGASTPTAYPEASNTFLTKSNIDVSNNQNMAGLDNMYAQGASSMTSVKSGEANSNNNFNNFDNAGNIHNIDGTGRGEASYWAGDVIPSTGAGSINTDASKSQTKASKISNDFVTRTNIDVSNDPKYNGQEPISSQGTSGVVDTSMSGLVAAEINSNNFNNAGNVQNNEQVTGGESVYLTKDAPGMQGSMNANLDSTNSQAASSNAANEFLQPHSDIYNNQNVAGQEYIHTQGSSSVVASSMANDKSGTASNFNNDIMVDQVGGIDQHYLGNEATTAHGSGTAKKDATQLQAINVEMPNNLNLAVADNVYTEGAIDTSLTNVQPSETNQNNVNGAANVQYVDTVGINAKTDVVNAAVGPVGEENINVDSITSQTSSLGSSKQSITQPKYDASNNQNNAGQEGIYPQSSPGVVDTNVKLTDTAFNSMDNAKNTPTIDQVYAINDGAVSQGSEIAYTDAAPKSISQSNTDVSNNLNSAIEGNIYQHDPSIVQNAGKIDVKSGGTNLNDMNNAGNVQNNDLNIGGGDQVYLINEATASQGSSNTHVDKAGMLNTENVNNQNKLVKEKLSTGGASAVVEGAPNVGVEHIAASIHPLFDSANVQSTLTEKGNADAGNTNNNLVKDTANAASVVESGISNSAPAHTSATETEALPGSNHPNFSVTESLKKQSQQAASNQEHTAAMDGGILGVLSFDPTGTHEPASGTTRTSPDTKINSADTKNKAVSTASGADAKFAKELISSNHPNFMVTKAMNAQTKPSSSVDKASTGVLNQQSELTNLNNEYTATDKENPNYTIKGTDVSQVKPIVGDKTVAVDGNFKANDLNSKVGSVGSSSQQSMGIQDQPHYDANQMDGVNNVIVESISASSPGQAADMLAVKEGISDKNIYQDQTVNPQNNNNAGFDATSSGSPSAETLSVANVDRNQVGQTVDVYAHSADANKAIFDISPAVSSSAVAAATSIGDVDNNRAGQTVDSLYPTIGAVDDNQAGQTVDSLYPTIGAVDNSQAGQTADSLYPNPAGENTSMLGPATDKSNTVGNNQGSTVDNNQAIGKIDSTAAASQTSGSVANDLSSLVNPLTKVTQAFLAAMNSQGPEQQASTSSASHVSTSSGQAATNAKESGSLAGQVVDLSPFRSQQIVSMASLQPGSGSSSTMGAGLDAVMSSLGQGGLSGNQWVIDTHSGPPYTPTNDLAVPATGTAVTDSQFHRTPFVPGARTSSSSSSATMGPRLSAMNSFLLGDLLNIDAGSALNVDFAMPDVPDFLGRPGRNAADPGTATSPRRLQSRQLQSRSVVF